MALTIKHTKVSAIPDGTDASLIRPSDWNADHSLAGVAEIAQGGTGQTTAQAAVNALLPAQTGNAGKVLGTDGTNTSWVDKGASGGVTQIIAGTNVTIDPVSGVGAVTINASGGGSTLIGQTQSVSPYETSLGFDAGLNNTGVNNTYLGFAAGRACTGATNNVIIGYQAMDVATIPSSNVIIGSSACGTSGNTSQNVVIGYNAASGTTSLGSDSVIIGNDAGRTVTGTSNVLIGSSCGNNVTTGSQMVAVGLGCFGAATASAAGAVAVGHNALGALTTGAGNVAVGFTAGDVITTGSYNTLMGSNAGGVLVGADYNTMVGFDCGKAATGAGTTAFGAQTALSLTTGTNNTFIGRASGSVVTTGSNNTIIGSYPGTTAMAGMTILSDGAGTIKLAINATGGVAFSNLFQYGTLGQTLRSGGSTSVPSWEWENSQTYQNLNANTLLTVNKAINFVDCTSGNLTVTLPTAVGAGGQTITVKRTDSTANTLTVASGGGFIEGNASASVGPEVSIVFCSDNANWWELANG